MEALKQPQVTNMAIQRTTERIGRIMDNEVDDSDWNEVEMGAMSLETSARADPSVMGL